MGKGNNTNQTLAMPQVLVLSCADKYLVTRIWNDDFDATFDLAICIYEHLFLEDRTIAVMFPNVDPDHMELRGNPTFSRMAMRLVRVLTTTVRQLNDFSQLNAMLDQLGKLE